jgi:hypothetical protein
VGSVAGGVAGGVAVAEARGRRTVGGRGRCRGFVKEAEGNKKKNTTYVRRPTCLFWSPEPQKQLIFFFKKYLRGVVNFPCRKTP